MFWPPAIALLGEITSLHSSKDHLYCWGVESDSPPVSANMAHAAASIKKVREAELDEKEKNLERERKKQRKIPRDRMERKRKVWRASAPPPPFVALYGTISLWNRQLHPPFFHHSPAPFPSTVLQLARICCIGRRCPSRMGILLFDQNSPLHFPLSLSVRLFCLRAGFPSLPAYSQRRKDCHMAGGWSSSHCLCLYYWTSFWHFLTDCRTSDWE